jgi:hypothetical protein
MTNPTLIRLVKSAILDMLYDCSIEQRDLFIRIYSKDINLSIEKVVDNIKNDYLESAISLVERTVEKNKSL